MRLFGNLECLLYDPHRTGIASSRRGFFADPAIAGEALKPRRIWRGRAGEQRRLRRSGDPQARSARPTGSASPIPGRAADVAAARGPAASSSAAVYGTRIVRGAAPVYWPTNHEAGAKSAGIAALRAHTAYQVPAHKTRPEIPPMNRPGVPPIVVTYGRTAPISPLSPRTSRRCEATGRHRRRLVPLGARRGGARLYDRNRPRRDRCRG